MSGQAGGCNGGAQRPLAKLAGYYPAQLALYDIAFRPGFAVLPLPVPLNFTHPSAPAPPAVLSLAIPAACLTSAFAWFNH